MKKLYLYFFLLTSPLCSMAMGGVWVLEIEFMLNGTYQSGYVVADFWAEDSELFKTNDSLFNRKFLKYFPSEEPLKIYTELIDNEIIKEAAAFPIHPFELIEQSVIEVNPADFKEMYFLRLWKRDDYMIKVLTEISISDTSWISGTDTVIYPEPQEVGCRIEAYIFDGKQKWEALLQRFMEIYLKADPLSIAETVEKHDILQLLKKKKVVVVELCGC